MVTGRAASAGDGEEWGGGGREGGAVMGKKGEGGRRGVDGEIMAAG